MFKIMIAIKLMIILAATVLSQSGGIRRGNAIHQLNSVKVYQQADHCDDFVGQVVFQSL